MNAIVRISLENQIFQEDMNVELSRIFSNLSKVAEFSYFTDKDQPYKIYDLNGNFIGEFLITE